MDGQAQFELMRFQVMSFAFSDAGRIKISDEYLFAWDRKVFPYYDEAAEWHLPFRDNFAVSEAQVSELADYLSDCWDKKQVPTFYELEDHYQTRAGTTWWDRAKLITVCRYFFLHESFDADFWKKLIEPMQHPTEAQSVIRKLDRDRDVYFN